MATADEIKLIVSAEIRKAVEDLKKVRDEAGKTGKQGAQGLGALSGAATKGTEALADMGGAGGKLGGIIGKLPGPLKAAALAVAAVAGAAVAYIAVGMKFADAASEQEQSMRKLQAVTKSSGVSFSEAKKAAQELASDGLMTFQESASALSNLLASGMSLPKAIDLLKIAKDNAVTNRQANYRLGESVVVFTEGIKNQNSMLTDSVGIQKNYSKILEEGAAAMGKTVDQLTERQKAEIVANGFIKEGAAFMGQAADAANTYAGAKARAEAANKQLSVTIGQWFMPQMQAVKKIVAEAAEGLERLFRETVGENPLERQIQDVTADIARYERTITEAGQAAQQFQGMSPAQVAQLRNTQTELANARVRLTELTARMGEQVARDEVGEKKRALKAYEKATGQTAETVATLFRNSTSKQIYDAMKAARESADAWRLYVDETGRVLRDSDTERTKSTLDLMGKAIEYGVISKNISAAELATKRQLIEKDKEQRAALENIVAELERDEKARRELADAIREAADEGIRFTESERKAAGFNAEFVKKRISDVKKEKEEREKLLAVAKEMGLVESDVSTLTTSELKKRIDAHKQAAQIIAAIASGTRELANSAFEYSAQLRKNDLDDQLNALRTAHDAEMAAFENSNQFTGQISAMEKERRKAQQAEKDADLAAQKKRIEDEIAATDDAEEKKRLQAELTAVEKQIAEETYQKNLDAMREAERVKNDEIEKAKAAANDAYEKKVKELKRKAFEADKEAKIGQAIMNGAMAITMTFAQGGFLNPLSWIAAGVGAANTVLQVATISAQKFPEYRVGVDYIPQDQIAMLHEGERVLTKNENRTFNQNMGGMTVNLYGVQDAEGLARGIDDYLKRNGSILGVT